MTFILMNLREPTGSKPKVPVLHVATLGAEKVNRKKRSIKSKEYSPLPINFFIVIDSVNNALTGNFSVLELFDKHGFLLKRLVLFKEVL